MKIPASKVGLIALITIWNLILSIQAETFPIPSPLSADALAEDELTPQQRQQRLIFNIYRGENTPKEAGYLIANDDVSPTGTRVTVQGPLAGLRRLTNSLFDPQTRETLRNLRRDFQQRARNLYRTSTTLLGTAAQSLSGATGTGGRSFNFGGSGTGLSSGTTFGDSTSTGLGDGSETRPATGFRLFTPETRESLRTLGTTLGQTEGRLFRTAQTTATRLAARLRPTTERAFISDFEADNTLTN